MKRSDMPGPMCRELSLQVPSSPRRTDGKGILLFPVRVARANDIGSFAVPDRLCRRHSFAPRYPSFPNVGQATDVPKKTGSQGLMTGPTMRAQGAEPERCLRLPIIWPGKPERIRTMDLKGKKIAILATNGFEQAELEVPRDRLSKAGATVDVVSLASGEIKGWDKKDWGRPVKVDKTLDEVSAGDYDAIVLPGGQINPDLLRVEPKALKFIKDIFDAKKVVAAVCHAPWLLIETGIAKGRRMTSFKSIKTDVANAGAKWEDSEVVVDQGVITSRNPGDLEAFSAKIIEEVKEGRHTQRSAA
jgi:protease I